MKNRGSWRGTLVVVFAIGAGWIGYMGWPLYGLITLGCRAIQFTKSPAGTCGGPRSKLSRKRQPCTHVPSCERNKAFEYKEVQVAAHSMNLTLQAFKANSPSGIDAAFVRMASDQAQALMILADDS